jgi:hypothetical protein
VLTLSEGIDDEHEDDEGEEDDIEFLESGKDAAEAFQPAEKPFHFVALFVEFAVVFPGIEPVGLGRNHRNHAQIEHQLPRLVALIGFIHQHGKPFRHGAKLAQQRPSLGRIMRVARRQSEDYSRSSIRGNQMNLGVPSAARFADSLGSVFFNAPVPSG